MYQVKSDDHKPLLIPRQNQPMKSPFNNDPALLHPLPRHTYLYNIIHENTKLIKEILFNKHKRVHVDKRFTSTLIIKLKSYQIRV